MKGKAAIILGVAVAMTLIVVLMFFSPDQAPPVKPQAIESKPAEKTGAAVSTEAGAAGAEPAPAAPKPLPTAEELSAMEDRIARTADRMPLFYRTAYKMRFFNQGMSGEDWNAVRGLYLRLLDNYARIQTARCHIKAYETSVDGNEQLVSESDMYWLVTPAACKQRTERTSWEKQGKSRQVLVKYDGRSWTVWEEGKVTDQGRQYLPRVPLQLYHWQMMQMREERPPFLCAFGEVDLDDGSRGYSRLCGSGREERFDTATGMLVECRIPNSGQKPYETYTYQNVNGIWFPKEIQSVGTDAAGNFIPVRRVFSQVVLNEPVDESLFDVNKPF